LRGCGGIEAFQISTQRKERPSVDGKEDCASFPKEIQKGIPKPETVNPKMWFISEREFRNPEP
jgi:hypothetical protein